MAIARSLCLSRRGALIRWVTLGCAGAPLLGAVAYGYGWPMPMKDCSFQATYGFFGPSCGLTRSFVAIAQGHWVTAIQFHLFGPPLFALFCAIAVQSLLELVRRQTVPAPWSLFNLLARYPWLAVLMTLAMVAYYSLRLVSQYAAEAVPLALQQTDLWQWLTSGAALL